MTWKHWRGWGNSSSEPELGRSFVIRDYKATLLINWKAPANWKFWASSAVAAEKESRVLSYRTSAAWEFNRHMSLAAYRVPFGYRRNAERKYERDPEQIETAIRLKEIFFEENGNITRLRDRAKSELNLVLSPQTYRDLINVSSG
ncbi:hypothetical protein H6F89_20890 [Cyanobacteria bacterium FACHB-63]|nr:hypothetical protein [Cyanobacteria bacterium FACHB-63]